MEYTVLTFIKVQFTGGWWQVESPNKQLTSYQPSVKSAKVLVVTDWPGPGVHTYEFEITQPDTVITSTGRNIIQIPRTCLSKTAGDTTNCMKQG